MNGFQCLASRFKYLSKLNLNMQSNGFFTKQTNSGGYKRKIFLVALLSLAISLLTVSAQNTASKQINLSLTNATLKELFNAIEQASNFRFLYDAKDVNANARVTAIYTNTSIDRILREKLTDYVYEIKGNQIVVRSKPTSEVTIAQTTAIHITGVVTDAAGEPIPGASIIVKNTANGTATDVSENATLRGTIIGTVSDVNGIYTIQVPDRSAILVFSFVGMKKMEIPVGENVRIDVTMQEEFVDMEEVVVLGYTTSKRRDMISSIAKVSSDAISTPAYTNIRSALQGKASGVYVTGDDIRIRGVNSISLNTAPIWVIDGMQGDGSGLNPNDIESITILKDAAATALYGSNGANGVIVVTTKSYASQKTNLNIGIDVGLSHYIGTDWKLMDSKTFLETYDLARANDFKYSGIGSQTWNHLESFNNSPRLTPYPMTREEALNYTNKGLEESTRTALYHQVYVSANRSFEKGNAMFSITYRDSENVMRGGEGERFVGRVSFNLSPVKIVNVRFDSYTNFDANKTNTADNTLLRVPFWPIYNEDDPTGYWAPAANPLIQADSKYRQNHSKGFSTNNYLRVDIDLPFIEGLRIGGVGNAGASARRVNGWYAPVLMTFNDIQEISTASESVSFNYSYSIRGEISYNRTFGNHTIGVMGWAEGSKSFARPLSASGYNLNGSYPMLGTPGNMTNMSASYGEYGNVAYLGRFTYNFKSKYLLEANIRRDGLSTLPPNNRYANFASVGAGWTISDESFWNIAAINLLKIRGSYGKTGNANVPAFAYLPGFNIRNANGGSYEQYMYTQIRNIAADIKWETSDNLDIGFDFGLFNNRINGSLAYYNKETSGLLLQVPLPISAGLSTGTGNTVWANIGNMRNNGIEFNVDATVITSSAFSWSTSFNHTLQKNKVLSLAPSIDLTGSGIFGDEPTRTLTRAGGKLGTYYMAEWAGIDPQRGIPLIQERDAAIFSETGNTVHTGRTIPGTISNTGGNQFFLDGKSYIPNFFGGWRNTFRYGNWDLNLMISYTGGHYYLDQIEYDLLHVNMGVFNLLSEVAEKSWRQPGDNAKYQEIIYNGGFYYNDEGEPTNVLYRAFDSRNPNSTNFLKSGDNVQLKEVTLGYNLPRTVVRKAGMDSARLYFNINNVAYWAKDQHNGNPDVAVASNNVNGISRGAVFMTRTFSLGVSVKY